MSNNSILFKKATTKRIKSIIDKISVRKSAGQDHIRPIDIKSACDNLISTITKLINISVNKGVYPNDLKKGLVRPIYKNGTESNYANYRPITILPILNKIFEKYIAGLIHGYYNEYDTLTDTQYGFRQNKSTSLLLSKFTDEINKCLDNKEHVLLVFIDYSKAFDTLRHDQLIQKLDNTGIRGPLLNWCKNYLENRTYMVQIGNSSSREVDVSIGTAQGSVLGPLHYLVYVNDVAEVIKHCSLYQFADDTCLIASDKNIRVAMKKLQSDFTTICAWSHDAGLVLNAKKTQMMHIRSSHNMSDISPKLLSQCHKCLHNNNRSCRDCTTIDLVDEATYLGVTVDSRFNWGPHINKVCNKLRALMAKLKIIKYRTPYNILLNIYKSLAESIVSYGLTSYGRTYKTYLDQIELLQIRILKQIVPNHVKIKYRDDYAKLFKHCKVIPISKKVKYALLAEQYNRQDLIKPIQHKIITRKVTNKELTTYRCTNTYGKRTDKYLIPRLINDLPQTLKKTINNKNLKIKLKQHFLSLP
ncbi:hypothetical protein JYU34_018628 [Plutella xylostella]|uniref:Reverse transcriptase domain-containing protein n=1 Tax=Plutella xylostella TaxID=51655 RepID=A0ABQ7PZF8_PLUXY|nr:hypothetical protein JYU34_018628 [Plutella xylostella]